VLLHAVVTFDICIVCREEINSVVVIIPPISSSSVLSEPLSISLQLNDGSRLDTNHKFTYRLNPVLADIVPRNHLVMYVLIL